MPGLERATTPSRRRVGRRRAGPLLRTRLGAACKRFAYSRLFRRRRSGVARALWRVISFRDPHANPQDNRYRFVFHHDTTHHFIRREFPAARQTAGRGGKTARRRIAERLTRRWLLLAARRQPQQPG